MKKLILAVVAILIFAGTAASAPASTDVRAERRALAHYISAHIDTALKGE